MTTLLLTNRLVICADLDSEPAGTPPRHAARKYAVIPAKAGIHFSAVRQDGIGTLPQQNQTDANWIPAFAEMKTLYKACASSALDGYVDIYSGLSAAAGPGPWVSDLLMPLHRPGAQDEPRNASRP